MCMPLFWRCCMWSGLLVLEWCPTVSYGVRRLLLLCLQRECFSSRRLDYQVKVNVRVLVACCLHNLCLNIDIGSSLLCLHCSYCVCALVCLSCASVHVPPVPQPPTITLQSPKDYIFDPRENIVIHCEAKGKPNPRWDSHSSCCHRD